MLTKPKHYLVKDDCLACMNIKSGDVVEISSAGSLTINDVALVVDSNRIQALKLFQDITESFYVIGKVTRRISWF